MNLEKIAIYKLIVFNTVLRYGSAATAARILKVPIIKVHNDIKSLEKAMGVPLMMRNRRKIELTEAGSKVANLARAIIDTLNKEDQNIAALVPNDLVIAAPHGFCNNVLPEILVKFKNLYPQVNLRVLSGTDHLDFTDNDVDVVIGDLLTNRSDLTQTFLLTNTYRLYSSSDYIKQHGEPQTFEDLKNHEIVHYLGFPYSLEKIERDSHIYLESNNFNMIAKLIAKGLGIGLLRKESLLYNPEIDAALVPLFHGHIFYQQKLMYITRKFSSKSQLTSSLHTLTRECVERHKLE